MSYTEIFMVGWNLNALMFMINLSLAVKVFKSNDIVNLNKESENLKELKERFEELYPYRKYDILITYLFPFTAFFRVSFRIFEMTMFFNKNEGTKMYDFIVYKYQTDIDKKEDN